MRVFNTITRRKEQFKTVVHNQVRMYVCGPTVYDLFHIGNARTFVFFDVVRRYLEYRGYEVFYVQNFTDIDDKIINKASSEQADISKVSEKYINEYYKDADCLTIKRGSLNPKATENIKEMIELIEELIIKNFAYEADGCVYFSVKSFKDYGKLFGQNLDTLKSGVRIEVNQDKKDPLDFIMWKKSKESEPGYDSPWGKGRPGWHTECCSMIKKYFNNSTIDIHGGGVDLIFPHHENEIAQAEVLSGNPLANYWMHCSFLNIDKRKMSKSLGNFFTTREILERYSSNCLRFFLISSHYRSELCFSEDQLVWAEKSLERIYNAYNLLIQSSNEILCDEICKRDEILNFKNKFINKMDDDFNTSDAISVIFDFIKFINVFINNFSKDDLILCKNILEELLGILGIFFEENREEKLLSDELRNKILRRYEFKKNKDFVSADLIRDELLKEGIALEDIKNGVNVKNLNNNNMLVCTLLY